MKLLDHLSLGPLARKWTERPSLDSFIVALALATLVALAFGWIA